MRVVVPTNRIDKVKTLKIFPEAELFINDFNNVSKARNSILDKYVNEDYVLMLDDDLLSLKFSKTREEVNIDEMFKYHLDIMKNYHFPIMGIGSPLQGFRATKETKVFARMFSAYYIDIERFKKNGFRFDEELANIEDFDMAMQVFDKGLVPAVNYRYAMDFDHWAKGGCNNYRTAEFQKEKTRIFINKWRKYRKFIKPIINPVSKMWEPAVQYTKLLKQVRNL